MWIGDDDYPPEALKDNIEGNVSFVLTVGPDGLPSECKVTGTSGSALLDDTACSLLIKRARFEPARDAQDQPVSATYTNRVRWVLPRTVPAPKESNVELSFVITKDGSVTDCNLVDAKGVPAETIGHLTDPCIRTEYDPYLDDLGNPVARKVTMRTSVTSEPVK